MTSPDQPGRNRPGQNQLGEFLRARRGRLCPADVGLPAGIGPRRTPGLRREEPFRHPLVGEFTLSYEVLHLDPPA